MYHEKRPFFLRPLQLIVWLLLSAFFTTALFAAPPSSDLGARWTIDFDFTQGFIDADLIIETGIINSSGELVDITVHPAIPIRCWPTNNTLIFDDEGALFDGTDYVQCDLPDIRKIVYNLTNGELLMKKECECKKPWIEGDVWIDPQGNLEGTNETAGARTLFYHPDIQLDTAVSSTQDQANYHLRVDQGIFWSDFFYLANEIVPIGAALSQNSALIYESAFFYESTTVQGYGGSYNSLKISTGPATIYVGHQPGGNNFMGVVRTLRVDPPCIGGSI